MHPRMTNIIGFSCQDKDLKANFFSLLFSTFSMPQDSEAAKMSSEELNELIANLGDDELQKWKISISDYEFAFVDTNKKLDQKVPKIQNYTLLFQVGDDLSELPLDHLKDSMGEKPNLLVMICKPTPKIKDVTVNKFENEVVNTLTQELGVNIQKDMIIQLCLSEPNNPLGSTFAQTLCRWAKIKDEQSSIQQQQNQTIDAKQAAFSAIDSIMNKYLVKNQQDCSEDLLNGNFEEAIIYAPKLQRQKFAEQIKNCRELKQFLDTLKTDLTQEQIFKINLTEGLQAIVAAYNLLQPEDCLQQLLERHPQDAVLMVQKKNRAKFLKEIQSCQLYQRFLQSFQQQNLVQTVLPPSPQDLKKQAEPFLRSLLEKYSVKMKQECIQEIFEKNIEDAVLRASKKERNSFQQEILACEKLTAYWKSLQNPNAQSEEEILRRSAEAKINELLEQYGASDVEELCKAILENKLQEIISQIPRKHRQKFKKDCENCEDLQLYLESKQKQSQKEIDPKIDAIESLEKLLQKYNVKNIKDGVQELLESNLDDALLRIKRDLREPFKKDLNQCLPYLNYIDSLKKPNEGQVLKKEAEAEMLSLLDKYGVSSPEDVIQDLMKGNIAAALDQIPTRKKPLFKEDYEKNQKIRQFLSSIIEKPSENAEQIASRALLALFSKFNVKNPNDCLKELLQGNIDDAALEVKSQQRQKFKQQIKNCQQYQQFLNGSKSDEEPLKLSATRAVYSIFDKYKVKAKQECLEEVFSKNLSDASLEVKKQMRQAFINELNQCKELKTYWELLDPPKEGDLLKIQAISAATKILENYGADVQQCLAKVLQFQLEDIKGEVKKAKVNSFMSDLNNCEVLKRYWATNAPEVIDYEKEARKSLENICREFKVMDVKQCIDECIAKRIEDAALNVGRALRDAFIRAINECQQYQIFLGSTNQQNMLLKKAESSLIIIFQKYKVTDVQECLKDVFEGNLKNAAFSVKTTLRAQFLKQLNECSDYKSYLESLIPEDQNTVLKKATESALRVILIKYMTDASDVDFCLPFLLQNQIDTVLSQIRPNKRNLCEKELEKSVEYQAYLKSLNGSIDNKYKLVKQELINAGLDQSKIAEIISGLKEGSIQIMKQSLGIAKFYPIFDKLTQNNDFFSSINENQAVNSEFISYFYYFLNKSAQLNQTIEIMLNLQPEVAITDKGTFIQTLSKAQQKKRVQVISKEIKLLQEIYEQANSEKAKLLQEALEDVRQITLIDMHYKIHDYLKQQKIKGNINVKEIQKKILEKKQQLSKAKNRATKEEYKNQLSKLEKTLSLIEQKKNSQALLQISDVSQLILRYIQILNKEKISEGQLSQYVQKYKKIAITLINSNNEEYLSKKVLEVRYTLYQRFFTLYKEQVELIMVKIHYEDKMWIIFLENQIQGSLIYERVCKQIGQSDLCVELNYEDKDKIIINKNSKQVYAKPDNIKCFKTIPVNLQFRKKIYKINISKQLSAQSLKSIVHSCLRDQSFDISIENICLFGVFGQKSDFVLIQEEIEVTEMKRLDTFKYLNIIVKMSVVIYYEVDSYRFALQSDKTIEELKKLIFEASKIPIKSQSLLYAKQNMEEEVFSQRLDQIQPNLSNVAFSLISKMNLEHYGFHENYPLNFTSYTEFFIEKANDIQEMVNSCTLKKQQEKNFFDQLIKFLYSAVKRRFPFSHITDQVKAMVVQKNSQEIWSGDDFSEYFLVYYILYNADQKLRIQLMNILRTFVPLPLFFKEFQSINHIKEEWVINHQLLWLLHSGLCITSVGLHTENIAMEKGKTQLNNQLFFTNFQDYGTKHPISFGCPEIVLKALGNIIPVNIIDVPSQTPKEIVQNIYKITDFLIIHSWKGKKQSEKIVEEIKEKYEIKYIICLLRDSKNKEETITRVKNARFQQNCYVELHNLQDNKKRKKQSFIQILKEKIWEFGNKAFDSSNKRTKSIYKLFKNKLFEDFSEKLRPIKEKFFDLKVIFTKYEKIKDLKKQNNIQSLNKADRIKDETIKNEIASQFKNVLLFIDKNKEFSEILMLRFREVLKEIKTQQERKYFIINQYKKKIALLAKDKNEELQQLIDQSVNQIAALPKMIKINKKTSQAEMVEQLSNVFDYFQNEIKSTFFTIELAWRQLQYLTTLSNEVKLGDICLIDFLIDIKRKEISNSQPFELLDGDLLEMPKNIMKKVFEGISDRVIVITILGPQSSGKSTLLNFLFGCDFGTSEGRCTKGVYGTYFKFSNIRLPNCEGVFLIDTEGLFATLNKKDTARRKDFDSKLVLFCLAVSDFVIINTKGNLDSESSRILKSSMERFGALAEQNLEWPEIFLILNQNNSANINTSQADINKLREIFTGQNSWSLNQAYSLIELTKKDIAMLPQSQSLVKRQPREEFLSLTNQLQNSLISKIEKKNAKSISVVIDLMERVWSTIEAFPDLGKTASKKIQEIEKNINFWRIQKIENLTAKRQAIFEQFKQNKINEKKCQTALLDEIIKIQNEFKQAFLSEKNLESMAEDQKIKIELEQKKIQLSFEAIKYQLSLQIRDLEKSRLADKSKSQGSEYEKEAIRIVKKIQREEKRALSNEEKQVYFDKAFNISLQKVKLIAAPEQQLQNYFERTYEFYGSASSITSTNKSKGDTGKSAGLPRAQWKCDGKIDYPQFSESIITKIFTLIGRESNKYIQFKKTPPTKVLDESARTDAKLEYFNMRNYFQKVKVSTFYEISLDNFKSCLKIELLRNEISQMYTKKNKFEHLIILKIFEKLNKLFQAYGFVIDSFENFRTYLQYKLKFCSWFQRQPEIKIRFYTNQSTSAKHEKKKGQGSKKSSSKINHQETRISTSGYNTQHTSYSSSISQSMNRSSRFEQVLSSQLKQNDNQSSGNESDEKQLQIIKEEDFDDFNQYVHINLLDKKIKQINQYGYSYSTMNYISKCLKDIINWTAVKNQIEKSTEFDNIKKEINKQVQIILKRDLKQFGLTIECYDYYEYIYNQRYGLRMEFKRIQEVKAFENESIFFKELKKFSFFDDTKTMQLLKKSVSKTPSYYYIQLGAYQQQTFEVKPDYRNTKELQTYISNDTSCVYVNLQSDTMKEFVYKELIKNNTFKTLFHKIDAIILKSSNYLNTTTITGIYIDVSREITQFNNDLCQVSHKMTLIFTGYIHLYAIYLTWKKFSEQALKVANRPYNELLQTRSRQLSFFINETSDNDNLRSVGEADRFLNKILEYCKTLIEDHKKKVNDNESKKFKKEYPRAVIQSKIDDESFNTSSKQSDWISYLEDPSKVIEKKYESLINFSTSNLQNLYKSCEKVGQLIKEFKEVIKQLLEKLKAEGLTQDTIHTDIFGLEKKTQKEISVSDNEVLEKVNTLMMKFFLDLLLKDEKATYSENDFDLQIKKQSQGIKIHREPTPNLQFLVGKLKDHELSITRFYTFVEIINAKLYERVNVGGVEFEKFDLQIKDMLKMSPDDEKDFRSLVTVKICNQLCPGCQRICGVEEAHTNNHECRYGHQMRALGGVKLSNGDASVIRCEDVQLMSEIQFNGKKMTWKEFKEFWETKTEGSWSFADLAHDKNKEKFIKAWDLAGEIICKKFEMKYVKSNALDAQKAAMSATTTQPTHYIFALDDSGSMYGQKWSDLMTSYKTAIEAIRKIGNAETSIKVSVLIEGSTCQLFQENSTPKNVNLNVIPRMSGNNFADTFGKACNLMTKYVGSAKIKYIFMTDGGCGYPSAQVTMIKNLKNSYPNKIEYSGIEFQTSGETMKLISKELGGTNQISYNVSQLTSAYLEIINRKV